MLARGVKRPAWKFMLMILIIIMIYRGAVAVRKIRRTITIRSRKD